MFFSLCLLLDEGQLCRNNSSNNNKTKTKKSVSATPIAKQLHAVLSCSVQILTPCVFWISTANSLKSNWPPSPKTAHYQSLKERNAQRGSGQLSTGQRWPSLTADKTINRQQIKRQENVHYWHIMQSSNFRQNWIVFVSLSVIKYRAHPLFSGSC